MENKEFKRKLSYQLELVDEYINDLIGRVKAVKLKTDLDCFMHRSIWPLYAFIFIILNRINELLKENNKKTYEEKDVFKLRSAFVHPETLVVSCHASIGREGSIREGSIRVTKKANVSKRGKYDKFQRDIIVFENQSCDYKGPWKINEAFFEKVVDGLKVIINSL